jgi:hypothetical protein
MRLNKLITFLAAAMSCAMGHSQEPATPTPLGSPPNTQIPSAPVPASIQLVQVPVLSVTQVQPSSGSLGETAYKVIYEYSGHQYSVQLPQDPGASLSLQLPVSKPPAPADAALVPAEAAYALAVQALPYPYVWSVGVLYRPMPYIAGVRYGGGAFKHGGRHGGRR